MSGQHGVYVVSVRRVAAGRPDRAAALREAAYAHVGLSVDGVDQEQTVLPAVFTDAGFGVSDLLALIEGLHGLRVANHDDTGGPRLPVFRDGKSVNSEGFITDQFLLSFGKDTVMDEQAGEWLACAEAAHATWPRLMDAIGASIGGVVFEDGSQDSREVALPKRRTPKSLRLKGGWDYDAEGNQVWLPIEEAWRRFVHHQQTRPDRQSRMDDETLARMREHMEGYYAGRTTTCPSQEPTCSTN